MERIRPKRVAAAIKEEVANILEYDLKDPRHGFITVTSVDVTADLRRVLIYVTVLGKEEDKQKTMKTLEHATGFIRKLIGERVKLRYTPELIFREDKAVKEEMRISEILEKIEKERADEDKGNS